MPTLYPLLGEAGLVVTSYGQIPEMVLRVSLPVELSTEVGWPGALKIL